MATVDDVIAVIEEETTRDMPKIACTSESETPTHSEFKIGNMTGAALLAAILPMLFRRLKADPAVATGPFVTTAVGVAAQAAAP